MAGKEEEVFVLNSSAIQGTVQEPPQWKCQKGHVSPSPMAYDAGDGTVTYCCFCCFRDWACREFSVVEVPR